MVVEFGTRKIELRGDETNHSEKLGHRRITGVGQCSILGKAGTSSDLACNNTDNRSSQCNRVSYTLNFEYLLLSCTSFSFSSSISVFPIYNSTIIAEHKSSPPSLSLHAMIMSWHWVQYFPIQHTPSTAYTKYCVHGVQYTLSTASTQEGLSSHHSHNDVLAPKCSISFRCASLYVSPPSGSSAWELKGKVTLLHCHDCKSTNWWIESQHPVHSPSTAFKLLSNLVCSWPASESSNLHDYGLKVHISLRGRWQPPSAFPNSLDHGVQVYLLTHLIMVE